MGTSGSGSRAAPAAVALAAVIAGVVGLPVGAYAARGLGLHGSLVGGELALVAPSLVALAVLRRLLPPGSLALRPLSPLDGALAVAFGLSVWLASLGLVGLQQLVWPPPEGYLEGFAQLHEMLAPSSPLAGFLALLAIAAAPALCEEVAFRGVAQPGLRPLLGRSGALAASALLFGLIHIDVAPGGLTAWRVPFAVGVGLGLGALRERSGRLAPCILAHAGLNALTWSLVALGGAEADAAGPEPLPALGALCAGGLVASLLLARRWRGEAPPLRLD
jgi:membrane protease YdiL (CAAX protease family)